MEKGISLSAKNNLAPIRDQLADMVRPGTSVIEFGCGKGELLMQLSKIIGYGLGIDKSRVLIDYASMQKRRRNIATVDFKCAELDYTYHHPETYDYAIASLFFHVIPVSDAIYLLSLMRDISRTVLVCGFVEPKTFFGKILLELDQRFSGHYGNFRVYQEFGYLEKIFTAADCGDPVAVDTPISAIKIYKISGKSP